MIRKIIHIMMVIVLPWSAYAQNSDSVQIANIYKNALSSRTAYNHLKVLCDEAYGRVPGSEQAARAVDLTKQMLESMDLDSVYLQPFQMPLWIPGHEAELRLQSSTEDVVELTSCLLAKSIATDSSGVRAPVIEVQTLKELAELGGKVEGKVIFFNRPFVDTFVNTFLGYRATVDQRYYGPLLAGSLGAKGVIVRSITPNLNDIPHTGAFLTVPEFKARQTAISSSMGDWYFNAVSENPVACPAVAISTIDADFLSHRLKNDPDTRIYLKTSCQLLPEVTTHNVIAEMRGSVHPEKIILIGAHIDGHHNTAGAHDDGAGCVQSMDVLRLFQELKIKPRHTLRVVLFMDEELYQTGGRAYKDYVAQSNEPHVFAFETDRGGFKPLGFTIDASDKILATLQCYESLFKPYLADEIIAGFSGVDINPLKDLGIPLGAIMTHSDRYFDVQHADNDTFDKINRHELQMGSGAIASFIYLIDKYGLE